MIPNLRGKPLLFGIKRQVLSFQTCFLNNCSGILSYFRDIIKKFKDPLHNSLMGPFREIMECVYHLEQQLEQLILNNAYQNISRFPALSVQISACFGP